MLVPVFEHNRFGECSVTFLLSQIFYSKAFLHITDPSQLETLKPQAGSKLTIEWRPDVRNKFVQTGINSPDRPWCYGTFRTQYAAASIRAGYKEPVLLYDIRRGVAANLVKNVPSDTLRQVMGHADDGATFRKYYQNPLAKVDFHGLFFHGQEDKNIDFSAISRKE